MDSKYVQLPNGKTVFQFGAIDCFTRKRVVDLAPSLTSEDGARFLHKVISGFPFPVQAIQSDGGAEFLGDFTNRMARPSPSGPVPPTNAIRATVYALPE